MLICARARASGDDADATVDDDSAADDVRRERRR